MEISTILIVGSITIQKHIHTNIYPGGSRQKQAKMNEKMSMSVCLCVRVKSVSSSGTVQELWQHAPHKAICYLPTTHTHTHREYGFNSR